MNTSQNTPAEQERKSEISCQLSISIDIAGSTAAKQQIRTFQERYGRHEEQFNEYLRAFCGVELDFYQGLDRATVARLDDLFVVKHIGDEIWCLVPLVASQTKRSQAVIDGVLRALSNVLDRHSEMTFAVTDRVEGPDFNPHEEIEWEPVDLAVKATVDLLEEVIDVTAFRHEFLVPRLLRRSTDEEETKAAARILEKLNFGSTQSVGTRVRTVVRTDYVGLDVDRFFRLTKFAQPGLIVAGDTLCDYMEWPRKSEVDARSDQLSCLLPVWDRELFDKYPDAAPDTGRLHTWTALARKEEILKGITTPYGFRYLMGSYSSIPGKARLKGYEGLFKPSVELLREAGLLGPPVRLEDDDTESNP